MPRTAIRSFRRMNAAERKVLLKGEAVAFAIAIAGGAALAAIIKLVAALT